MLQLEAQLAGATANANSALALAKQATSAMEVFLRTDWTKEWKNFFETEINKRVPKVMETQPPGTQGVVSGNSSAADVQELVGKVLKIEQNLNILGEWADKKEMQEANKNYGFSSRWAQPTTSSTSIPLNELLHGVKDLNDPLQTKVAGLSTLRVSTFLQKEQGVRTNKIQLRGQWWIPVGYKALDLGNGVFVFQRSKLWVMIIPIS